ncbi:MAG: SBBP repeat-containing protein, partial [Acidimicrobiia bacterium]|nr:SBBP repeat-containing protein [Acidimicrobiia bacterium]
MLKLRRRRRMVANRRIVPRPLLVRARSLGTVLLVVGIVAQSLAIFEGPAAAADAPALVGHAAAGEDTVAIPHGEEGDLLVLRIIHDSDESPESPAGWELVQNQALDDGPLVDVLLTRVADASEPSDFDLDMDGLVHVEVFRFAGVDPDQPIAAVSSLVGESDSATAPDLPIDDPAAMVIVTAVTVGPGELTPPPTMTTVASGSANGLQWMSASETVSAVAGSGARQIALGSERPWVATTLIVRPPQRANTPPVPDAGGPYSITVGESLELDASATTDADDDDLTVTWDINGDGDFSDAAGPEPVIPAATLEDLGVGVGTFSMSALVDDGTVGVVDGTVLEVIAAEGQPPQPSPEAAPSTPPPVEPPTSRVDVPVALDKVDRDMVFEPNVGQTDAVVDFTARGQGYVVHLTDGDAVVTLGQSDKRFAVRMNLERAADSPSLVPLDRRPGVVNYLIGNDPSEWHADVPTYGAVEYRDVYPGIDVRYYGNDRRLEYDFIIQPGSDPNAIVLGFDGATSLGLTQSGDLEIGLNPGRNIRFSAPVSFQEVDGVRVPIDSGYSVEQGAVGFWLGAYDPTLPLVIDPTLEYGTYLGGIGTDVIEDVEVDASGSVYAVGSVTSSGYPTTVGAFDTTQQAQEAVITKLSPDGSTLVYSTYLGGSAADKVYGLGLHANGEVTVAGMTGSSDFPTLNAYDSTIGGSVDGFVARLAAGGGSLLYSTFLGGSGFNEAVYDVAVDGSGNAYVTGYTDSSDFPLVSAFDSTLGTGYDAFVTKVAATGGSLVYSSLLGGSDGSDQGNKIAVDSSGSAYVTGNAVSTNFPTTASAFSTTASGGGDLFFSRVNAAGTALAYSTYFGGSGFDRGSGVAIGGSGVAYIAGYTQSTNFPVSAGAYDTTKSATDNDAVVLALDPTASGASSRVFATYLGGTGADLVYDVALGDSTIYTVGSTASTNLPVTGDAHQAAIDGSSDAFLAAFSLDGATLSYLTYLGGSGSETAYGAAVDGSGKVYLSGSTGSSNFDVSAGAYDQTNNGGTDGFVARFSGVPEVAPAGGTATFQQGSGGYSGTIDTWVSDVVPTQDNGDRDSIDTDTSPIEQGLLRFDGIVGTGAGQIPPGSTITSASLTLVNDNNAGSGGTLSLYRMLIPWAETATWNTLSSGIQTNGVEAAATPDVVYAGAELAVINSTSTITGLEAAVQAWVDGSPNYGWALILGGTTDGLDLLSSEHVTASSRPFLSVTYTTGAADE